HVDGAAAPPGAGGRRPPRARGARRTPKGWSAAAEGPRAPTPTEGLALCQGCRGLAPGVRLCRPFAESPGGRGHVIESAAAPACAGLRRTPGREAEAAHQIEGLALCRGCPANTHANGRSGTLSGMPRSCAWRSALSPLCGITRGVVVTSSKAPRRPHARACGALPGREAEAAHQIEGLALC